MTNLNNKTFPHLPTCLTIVWALAASSYATPDQSVTYPDEKGKAPKQIFIIGGGNQPDNSQAQIELNVNWIIDVINRQATNTDLTLFYTDHDGPIADIQKWVPVSEQDGNRYQPLARVFGDYRENGMEYRDNATSAVAASTIENVREELSSLMASDAKDITLIYNGHGSYHYDDTQLNALQLWNGGLFSAKELSTTLDALPNDKHFRYILTQCFSGAFAELSFNRQGKVCGFMAESPDRMAEGCSASVNTSDYRDYTTFFYAALDGKTRLDQPLPYSPDSNGDNTVDFREAHLFTLENAFSNDLSRSTSEVFLEKWAPWYVRWQSFGKLPDNEYAEIAQRIATKLKLDPTVASFRNEFNRLKIETLHTIDSLNTERATNKETASLLRKAIEKELFFRWPQLQSPYTEGYLKAVQQDLDAINATIMAHENYAQLVKLQDRDIAIDDELLASERQLTQLRKITRFRNLARLKAAIYAIGGEDSITAYQELLDCESSGSL